MVGHSDISSPYRVEQTEKGRLTAAGGPCVSLNVLRSYMRTIHVRVDPNT